MSRVKNKPTDKYLDYETRLSNQAAYISAVLNGELRTLQPIRIDGRYGPAILSQSYIPASHEDDVRIYTTVEWLNIHAPRQRVYFVSDGRLPEAIGSLQRAMEVSGEEAKSEYTERINQLASLRLQITTDRIMMGVAS